VHPDHSWEKIVFDPWRLQTWDANDAVLLTPETDIDAGSYFSRLPSGDYLPTWYSTNSATTAGNDQQDAARKASLCAATPATAFLDTLGRPFLTIAYNRTPAAGGGNPVEEQDRTLVEIDIQGRKRSITDALARRIMTYDYGMQGNVIHQSSVDAGERWSLADVSGKPLLSWDNLGHRVRHEYDASRRPTSLYLSTGGNPEILAERVVYGEGQPNDQALKLRTKIYQQFDGAGSATNNKYDFKGNLLSATRALLADYKNQVDWSRSPALDAASVFTANTTYDALNRPTSLTAPDGSVITPTYNERSLLNTVAATIGGAATGVVNAITYNPKGQRLSIVYANGASTAYDYDAKAFRLTRLATTRSIDSAVLQDLRYTYDPVGNITRINDAAQPVIYFSNQVVSANADYTYDALYRLVAATGREHIGQVSSPQTTWDDGPRMNQPQPNPNNPVVMRNYTESYSYDAVGNILAVVHQAANGAWTRSYNYDEPNSPYQTNRLTSTKVGVTTEAYKYNANGEMIQMPQLTLMNWDFKDQLQATSQQSVTSGTPQTTYYVYDASGQRVRKVTDNAASAGAAPVRAKERIYLGGFEIYREYGSDGTTPQLERQTLHIMDDKRRVAMVETKTIDNGQKVSTPVSLARYQFDNHLGSACLELDETARIISYEEYYPYGSTSYQAVDRTIQVSVKRYRYTGKERDDETGLCYHGARYYAPWLGRWISGDPLGATDGPNLYAYVHCSPCLRIDPSGMADQEHLIEQTGLQQPVTATAAGRGGPRGLPKTYQNLADQWQAGKVDVGHPDDMPLALTRAGTTSKVRAQLRGENRAQGATTNKAQVALAKAKELFYRVKGVDPTATKGTRYNQPKLLENLEKVKAPTPLEPTQLEMIVPSATGGEVALHLNSAAPTPAPSPTPSNQLELQLNIPSQATPATVGGEVPVAKPGIGAEAGEAAFGLAPMVLTYGWDVRRNQNNEDMRSIREKSNPSVEDIEFARKQGWEYVPTYQMTQTGPVLMGRHFEYNPGIQRRILELFHYLTTFEDPFDRIRQTQPRSLVYDPYFL
jgi:RHS repeat-associated protein